MGKRYASDGRQSKSDGLYGQRSYEGKVRMQRASKSAGKNVRPPRLPVEPKWRAGGWIARRLARHLNSDAEDVSLGHLRAGLVGFTDHYGAWRAAAAIVGPSVRHGVLGPHPLARKTVERFNRLASRARLPFRLSDKGHPELVDDARTAVVHLLWEFFQSPALGRLKQCRRCGRWFADESKNRTRVWCGRSCRNQAWNRQARRAAGHSQYKPRKKKREVVAGAARKR